MNTQELIDGIINLSYENYKYTPYVERKRVLELVSQLNEPQPIKLKDVIARIKSFDVGAKEVWLNEIKNELGSDYGTLKYKAGYEQGKFDGAIEREKVTVPQFVVDWYEECKDNLEYNLWSYIYNWGTKEECDFKNWLDLGRNNPIQTLINMHQFGYTVEKEKRYLVKMKGMKEDYNFLNLIRDKNVWVLSSLKEDRLFRTAHTRKELEEAGFGEVFNSPLFEVEEVQDDSKV